MSQFNVKQFIVSCVTVRSSASGSASLVIVAYALIDCRNVPCFKCPKRSSCLSFSDLAPLLPQRSIHPVCPDAASVLVQLFQAVYLVAVGFPLLNDGLEHVDESFPLLWCLRETSECSEDVLLRVLNRQQLVEHVNEGLVHEVEAVSSTIRVPRDGVEHSGYDAGLRTV